MLNFLVSRSVPFSIHNISLENLVLHLKITANSSDTLCFPFEIALAIFWSYSSLGLFSSVERGNPRARIFIVFNCCTLVISANKIKILTCQNLNCQVLYIDVNFFLVVACNELLMDPLKGKILLNLPSKQIQKKSKLTGIFCNHYFRRYSSDFTSIKTIFLD